MKTKSVKCRVCGFVFEFPIDWKDTEYEGCLTPSYCKKQEEKAEDRKQ